MSGRIFVTGDIHSDPTKLNTDNFPVGKELDKDDFVIICGDFGLVWQFTGESPREKFFLDWLEDKPFTTLFCDGNHENFERLNNYPVEEWHGGNVHKIRPSVIHLMRGQVFNLLGTKVFSFGGAQSHDIKDGILDPDKEEDCEKIYAWRRMPNKLFRILGVSWWKEELPSVDEYDEGIKNLRKNNYAVDIIVSHDCSETAQKTLGALQGNIYESNKLNAYFEDINKHIEFKKWFFGHYHVNQSLSRKIKCLYEDIVEVEELSGAPYEENENPFVQNRVR